MANHYPPFAPKTFLRFKRWTEFEDFSLGVSDIFVVTDCPRNQPYYECSYVDENKQEHTFELSYEQEDEVEVVSTGNGFYRDENRDVAILVALLKNIKKEFGDRIEAAVTPDDDCDEMDIDDIIKVMSAKYYC